MTNTLGTPRPDCHPRRSRSAERRASLAELANRRGAGVTSPNGEETSFGAGRLANYHKSLPHDVLGRVHAPTYQAMVAALTSGDAGSLETLPVGGNRSKAGPFTDTNPEQYAEYPGGAPGYRKLTSPLTGLVYDTQGADAGALAIGPAPEIASPEFAAEMAELYAMALLRDNSFTDIAAGTGNAAGGITVQAVIDALGTVPFLNGSVTGKLSRAARRRYESRGTITDGSSVFRGSTPGSKHGHWLSQFMLSGNANDSPAGKFVNLNGANTLDNNAAPAFRGIFAEVGHNDGFVFFGTQIIDQRSIVARPGVDYMTNWAAWLDSQNGVDGNNFDIFLGRRRYLTTPRDIATYVHYDALYQAYLVACLLMANDGGSFPKDRGMPETRSSTRSAFASFGGPHILSLVTEVATRALKAVWRQKWMHHRRMRPEVAAALITLHAADPDLLGHGDVADRVGTLRGAIPASLLTAIAAHNLEQNGASRIKPKATLPTGFPSIQDSANYLLPMAFPEGSPTHPAYGAGHATVAGACVTMLKAFFEMFEADGVTERAWPWPVVMPTFTNGNQNEGGELVPVPNAAGYTVQGELDKLAMNIANARNMAGVHYYTDYYESLRLGERVAVSIIEEQLSLYDEPVSMSFTTFDGEPIRITSNGDSSRVIVDGSHAPDWYERYGS
ncbi:vanadium-dependent haloperoxidase [Aurantimonas sp. HBX-1]|uniref:vanadium-dependent haloperoxidase n=1 Tax=Aurantimonas sp. HBX-1 TaxID=2906072 RepID=UPI001F391D5A|nr:vanadium-dependent haloperoxidase [Aurantimonas sp. HBX-1]UIJ70739.1 vanadium-dependent haloperoxidase [Aurantimonas sp. HBX-1]